MANLEKLFLEARADGHQYYRFEYELQSALHSIWEPDPQSEPDELVERSEGIDLYAIDFCLAEPEPLPWAIAFTPTFTKAIATADRKLQGRVLSALAELSSAPTTMHGDTRKPLTGELKGLWRYRFGDFRLIYLPRTDRQTVVLVDFAARGSVYDS